MQVVAGRMERAECGRKPFVLIAGAGSKGPQKGVEGWGVKQEKFVSQFCSLRVRDRGVRPEQDRGRPPSSACRASFSPGSSQVSPCARGLCVALPLLTGDVGLGPPSRPRFNWLTQSHSEVRGSRCSKTRTKQQHHISQERGKGSVSERPRDWRRDWRREGASFGSRGSQLVTRRLVGPLSQIGKWLTRAVEKK